jgi:hypothetical protein
LKSPSGSGTLLPSIVVIENVNRVTPLTGFVSDHILFPPVAESHRLKATSTVVGDIEVVSGAIPSVLVYGSSSTTGSAADPAPTNKKSNKPDSANTFFIVPLLL